MAGPSRSQARMAVVNGVVLAVAVFLIPAKAAGSATHSARRDRSVVQVRDTLEELRRSVGQIAQEADSSVAQISRACALAADALGSQGNLAAAVGARLRAEAEEAAAMVDEMEGNAQQVRSDIALADRAIRQLAAGGNDPPVGLSELKRTSAAAMRAQLVLISPGLAQAKATSAEAAQMSASHAAATKSSMRFASTVRHACANASAVAHADLDAGLRQKGSIEEALQALSVFGAHHLAAQRAPAAAGGPSFIQVSRSGTLGAGAAAAGGGASSQDIMDMFDDGEPDDDAAGSTGGAGHLSKPGPKERTGLDGATTDSIGGDGDGEHHGSVDDTLDLIDSDIVVDAPAAAPGSPPALSAAELASEGKELEQKVQKALSSVLEDSSQKKAARAGLCGKELERARLSLRQSKASAQELAAEASSHSDMATQLARDIGRVGASRQAVQNASAWFGAAVSRHKRGLARHVKDRTLAARILGQAVAVMSQVESKTKDPKHVHGVGAAVNAMQAAVQSLQEQRKASTMSRKWLTALVGSVTSAGSQVCSQLEEEGHDIEAAKATHSSEAARSAEGGRSQEGLTNRASRYVSQLEASCLAERDSHPRDVEHAAEVRALTDARDALEGRPVAAHTQSKQVGVSGARSGLRGHAGGRAARGASGSGGAAMTPLERAAAAMGIDVADR